MSDGRVTITVPDTPPSLNAFLKLHWAKRQRLKDEWQMRMRLELLKWGLPKDCDRIEAELAFQFPDRRRRDCDNLTATCSKFLGDALTPDFIADDNATRFWIRKSLILPETDAKATIITLDWWLSAAVAA